MQKAPTPEEGVQKEEAPQSLESMEVPESLEEKQEQGVVRLEEVKTDRPLTGAEMSARERVQKFADIEYERATEVEREQLGKESERLASMDDVEKVRELIALAHQKGVKRAIKVARKLRTTDARAVDAFHDVIAKEI